MIDAELLADLRRLVNTLRLPEYMRDLTASVPDRLVKEIAADFRGYNPHPAQDPSAKVVPQGAGRVIDGNDTVTSTGTGWVDAPKVDAWRPPGVEIADRLLDQADAIDRAERIRQLAQTATVQRAEAALKEPKPEPKEHKDREGK
jgi:hypothetical protein